MDRADPNTAESSGSPSPGEYRSSAQRAGRRVIAATCRTHGGSAGFTNLVVIREPCRVVLDPHADQSCVLTLDDTAARELVEALGQWLE